MPPLLAIIDWSDYAMPAASPVGRVSKLTMRCFVLIGLFTAISLTGYASQPDLIDRLVADLSASNGMWVNGYQTTIRLPKTASPEAVLAQILKESDFNFGPGGTVNGRVQEYEILQVRPVHVPSPTSRGRPDLYTAILVKTDHGEKIFILAPGDGWFWRCYDAHGYYGKVNMQDPPLVKAVQAQDRDKVISLLAHKTDVNAANLTGCTPLFYAALSGRADIAELLLSNGADVSLQAKDFGGMTPLHVAAMTNSKQVVKLLLAHHADPQAKDNSGLTPLHEALHNTSTGKEVIELLLPYESDVNARDKQGETLLHYAAEWGNLDGAEVLIAHHADVNATNDNGETPLHFALVRNRALADLMRRQGGHE